MKDLCTVSDYDYLCRGLTLYDSLCRRSHYEEWRLHYLAIDNKAYRKPVSLNLLEEQWPNETAIIGSRVQQGAPWNFRLFDWSEFTPDNRVVRYNGETYPLAWAHYSHFYPDFATGRYASGEANYGSFLLVSTVVRALYDEYNKLNRAAWLRYFK